MNKFKVYSPTQIAISTFIGGPGAIMYTLKNNFDALGDKEKSKQTILFGAVFVALSLVILPYLPDKFPNSVIPLGYTIAAHEIARKFQLSKEDILASNRYQLQSTRNIIVVGVVSLVAFVILYIGWVMLLGSLNLLPD